MGGGEEEEKKEVKQEEEDKDQKKMVSWSVSQFVCWSVGRLVWVLEVHETILFCYCVPGSSLRCVRDWDAHRRTYQGNKLWVKKVYFRDPYEQNLFLA